VNKFVLIIQSGGCPSILQGDCIAKNILSLWKLSVNPSYREIALQKIFNSWA
jgi:hypothetical protein